MISSMTGFGRGQAVGDGYEATVEVRTVNSRFCEVSIRGPRELNDREAQIQRQVKDTLARGRVTVNVQLERSRQDDLGMRVNESAVRGYRKLLEDVTRVSGIRDEGITLENLLRFQDIFESNEPAAGDSTAQWGPVSKALSEALDSLKEMRKVEGAALFDELSSRIDGIAAGLVQVRELAPERIPAARVRVRERLDEIIQEGRVDPERIEQEIAFLADRLDITEECVRLDAHLIAFREALASTEAVGRKLNFLAQEINREVNTIGSKANDADIALIVVGMKEDLEKVREQIENVE
ncbi:MAG: YicC family protein [Rhodothermales bacterium]|nr:YicC family protein [Rhodothermales bacterium]